MLLSTSQLTRLTDPASLGFTTTEALPDLQDVIGQPRALRALELGSSVPGTGYNIFVLGLPGSGRTTLSLEYLQRKVIGQPPPDDWVYVNNFVDARSPRAVCLPAGRGAGLRKDCQELMTFVASELPNAFQAEEYTSVRDRLTAELKETQEKQFKDLQAHVEKFGFILMRTPFGVVLTPGLHGQPLTPEEIEKLTDEQRTKIEQFATRLGEDVQKTLDGLRETGHQTNDKLKELDHRTILYHIQPFIEHIKERYTGLDNVLTHLDAIQKDVVEHAGLFHAKEEDASQGSRIEGLASRYAVNLLVDNSTLLEIAQAEGTTTSAPVIVESYPSYHNLLGSIEHEVVMGLTRTDFTLIRPGALHRANGGYLIVPARDLLINPYAWEGLKRVLRDGCIRIVELANQIGLVSTETLEPEPIPLQAKVVLVGTPLLYYLLREYDEDFAKLFKVRAEFATLMERTPEAEHEYALYVRSVVYDHHLPPFEASAVAEIIGYSARLAEDQDKLSTRFGLIADLTRESAYWAQKEHEKQNDPPPLVVTGQDVQRALLESRYRDDYIEDRIQELILNNVLLIATSGEAIGQINALSVMQMDDLGFGRPNRLTATVAPGHAGLVDIERQAQLGGPIHTKGVLILGGCLHHRYGQKHPLSLSASLAFEQSYSGVEGDSASAAELLTLLSAIADVPLRQDRAITGSINQHGQIQAIGGVNEKIEGFFYVCQRRGLSGEQGVVIPSANIRSLMLRPEVVQAVAAGQFHIWSIDHIDEAIALFTSLQAGERQTDETYPPDSFNGRVMKRLQDFSARAEKSESKPGQRAHKKKPNR